MKTLIIAALLATAIGCGDDDKPGPVKPAVLPSAPPSAEETRSPATTLGSGSIVGTVTLKGPVRPLKIAMDPQCLALHGGTPVKDESVVVDGESHVRWAMVYVKSGLEGKSYPVPQTPIVLDQKGCIYTPHVFGVMAGQPVRVRNSDSFAHNVHALPFDNKPFNFLQQGGQEDGADFKQPESGVKIKCDIHAWMRAWGHVFEHPFFAVTDQNGRFTIKQLPAGTYTIEVWHEVYKKLSQKVMLKEGESATLDFELVEKKE